MKRSLDAAAKSTSPPSSPPATRRSRLEPLADARDALFAAHGYVAVPDLLSSEELHALRRESSLLYQHARGADEIVAQGCVLDVMVECPMEEDAAARVDPQAYLDARETQIDARGGGGSLQIRAVVEELLFRKLPAIAAELLQSPSVCFFNEHYVVKPPRSAVEFRWHRDGDEQLAMCVHRAAIPPYVSAWCALDDVTQRNGPLRFVSASKLREARGGPRGAEDGDDEGDDRRTRAAKLDAVASEPVLASAGTVVFFLSDVWHCSSSNGSDAARRAFYAQYSATRITASTSDAWPLSFAVPCVVGRREERAERREDIVKCREDIFSTVEKSG